MLGTLALPRTRLADPPIGTGSIAVLPDRALARLVAGGDRTAFEVLYERYHTAIYRYCRAILRHTEDAEEAFQGTMMNAYRALAAGDGDVAVRPWLYQIAHNQCISLIRGRRPAEALSDHEPVQPGSVHEQVELQEQVRGLLADLEALPDQQRSALVMREMSGLSHRAIGHALATSPDDARQLVYEARRSLAEFDVGRSLSCVEVETRISSNDRRRMKGRQVKAHLRECASCRDFAGAQEARRRTFAIFVPFVPAAIAQGVLSHVLGGAQRSSYAGAGAFGSGAAAGSHNAATAGGVASAGAGVGIPSFLSAIAGIGGAAGTLGSASSGASASAGSASAFSTTSAGGLATAGVVTMTLLLTAAVGNIDRIAPNVLEAPSNASLSAAIEPTLTPPTAIPAATSGQSSAGGPTVSAVVPLVPVAPSGADADVTGGLGAPPSDPPPSESPAAPDLTAGIFDPGPGRVVQLPELDAGLAPAPPVVAPATPPVVAPATSPVASAPNGPPALAAPIGGGAPPIDGAGPDGAPPPAGDDGSAPGSGTPPSGIDDDPPSGIDDDPPSGIDDDPPSEIDDDPPSEIDDDPPSEIDDDPPPDEDDCR